MRGAEERFSVSFFIYALFFVLCSLLRGPFVGSYAWDSSLFFSSELSVRRPWSSSASLYLFSLPSSLYALHSSEKPCMYTISSIHTLRAFPSPFPSPSPSSPSFPTVEETL